MSIQTTVKPAPRRSSDFLGSLRSALLASLIVGVLWVSFFSLPLISDMANYDLWATTFAHTGSLPASAYRPPLYPLAVGYLYTVFGRQVSVIYYLQVLCNLGIALQLKRIGTLLHGERLGKISALTYLALPTSYVLCGSLLSEIPFTFLMMTGLYHVLVGNREQRMRHALLAGLAFGMASLTRSIALFLPFVMGAASMLTAPDKRQAVKRSLVMILIALSVIAPWTLRNYTLFNALVPIDTISGLNLYIGNHPLGDGGYIDLTGDPLLVAYTLPEPAWDKALKAAAIQGILKNPGHFLLNSVKRLAMFWSWPVDWTEILTAQSHGYLLPLLALSQAASTLLLLTCLWGAVRLFDKRPDTLVTFLPILYFCGLLSIFYVQARYRFPVMPLIIHLAIVTLDQRMTAYGGRTNNTSTISR